jgi:thiamine biosynthesis lipoprotein
MTLNEISPHLVSLQAAPFRVHRHRAMGTEFCLYLEALDQEHAEANERACFQAVFEEIDRVEAAFSRFRASSEISRLNRQAALGPVVTDPEVFRILAETQSIWLKTGGAFDIALGRLSRAWGFAERAPHVPEPEAIAEALSASGMALVALDAEWRTVQFLQPGVELDLGAFAKGYAVDCALEQLRAAGVAGVIDAGHSSIAAVGEPFESQWLIEVRLPPLEEPQDWSDPLSADCAADRVLSAVPLHGRAMASSGIMEQKFEQGGQTFSHLLDARSAPSIAPRLDRGIAPSVNPRKPGSDPARLMLQTTVLAPTSATADALSTALFILGPEEGSAVLSNFENACALWVYQDAAGIGWQHRNWPGEISGLNEGNCSSAFHPQ